MSDRIPTAYKQYVIAVLLADGWHDVHERSFMITYDDSMWRGLAELGKEPEPIFHFDNDDGTSTEGHLGSVLAVRWDEGEG